MTNLKKEISENGIHYTLQGDYDFFHAEGRKMKKCMRMFAFVLVYW